MESKRLDIKKVVEDSQHDIAKPKKDGRWVCFHGAVTMHKRQCNSIKNFCAVK